MAEELELIDPKGPYETVYRHDLLVGMRIKDGKKVTRNQATKMLDSLGSAKEALDWLIIDFLATLPTNYGKTLRIAQQMFDLSDRTLESKRLLGQKCPPEKREMRFTITHHRVIFAEYEMTEEQQDYWMRQLFRSTEIPGSGEYAWSAETLRGKIREELGLVPGIRLDDERHEWEIENDRLKREGWLAVGKVAVMQKFVADELIPAMGDDPDMGDIVKTLENFVSREDEISFPETPWHANATGSGGYEFYTLLADGSKVFSWESGHDRGAFEFLRQTNLIRFAEEGDA